HGPLRILLTVVDEHCNENNSSRWLSHSHALAKQVHFRLENGCCVRRLLLAAKIAFEMCVCPETRKRSEPLSGSDGAARPMPPHNRHSRCVELAVLQQETTPLLF